MNTVSVTKGKGEAMRRPQEVNERADTAVVSVAADGIRPACGGAVAVEGCCLFLRQADSPQSKVSFIGLFEGALADLGRRNVKVRKVNTERFADFNKAIDEGNFGEMIESIQDPDFVIRKQAYVGLGEYIEKHPEALTHELKDLLFPLLSAAALGDANKISSNAAEELLGHILYATDPDPANYEKGCAFSRFVSATRLCQGFDKSLGTPYAAFKKESVCHAKLTRFVEALKTAESKDETNVCLNFMVNSTMNPNWAIRQQACVSLAEHFSAHPDALSREQKEALLPLFTAAALFDPIASVSKAARELISSCLLIGKSRV